MWLTLGISEICLQIDIKKKKGQCSEVLSRDLKADVYEFQRLEFGVNAAPFISQVVGHEMQICTKRCALSPLKLS